MRVARKMSGGRAITPAFPVFSNCGPASSIAMAALRSARRDAHDNQGVIMQVDILGVNSEVARRSNGWAMAAARNIEAAPDTADSKAQAIAELMLEVAQCFFRVRAVGQKAGLITKWGGGAFGFMRSLALLGPLTVPQIAQMRPTSRQRMQRLADELAAEGLVEFIDNPKHRRSKLVRLTSKGEARYREFSARFLAIASTMGVGLSDAEIRKTIEIVRRLSDDVKARSERLS